MQIKSLPSYRNLPIHDITPKKAFDRVRKIETYRDLRAKSDRQGAALCSSTGAA